VHTDEATTVPPGRFPYAALPEAELRALAVADARQVRVGGGGSRDEGRDRVELLPRDPCDDDLVARERSGDGFDREVVGNAQVVEAGPTEGSEPVVAAEPGCERLGQGVALTRSTAGRAPFPA
jgi:hypothetical protein